MIYVAWDVLGLDEPTGRRRTGAGMASSRPTLELPLTERRRLLEDLGLPLASEGGGFALSHLTRRTSTDALEDGLRGGARPAQRGPHGQGPDLDLLAGPARLRLAEDEEGARDDRLRGRRRRGRARQAPRRAVRLHVRGPRRGARPAGHDRQGVQRPDRRRDRDDDPLVRGAHHQPPRPLPGRRADGRRRGRLRRDPPLEPPQVRASRCASRASRGCAWTRTPARPTRSRP